MDYDPNILKEEPVLLECNSDILNTPAWIDWNCTNYPLNPYNKGPSYRKITNLWGGKSLTGDLEWLSEFKTSAGSYAYRSTKAPCYSKDPKYLWFLDKSMKKFKISENNEETLAIENPIQKCKNKDCCSKSSTLTDCVYSWKTPNKDDGYCDDIGSRFAGPYKSTHDEWRYNSDPDIEIKDQNVSGTFCVKTQSDAGVFGTDDVYMRTYLGCDCDGRVGYGGGNCTNFIQGGERFNCTSNMKYDDEQIARSTNPSENRAEFQFIDEAAIAACCSLDPEQVEEYPQCKYAFNPNSPSNKCSAAMQDICKNHWSDTYDKNQNVGNDMGNKCNNFLIDSKANVETIQETIQNYITNPKRVPQDYISRELYKIGHPPSVAYYNNPYCKLASDLEDSSSDDESSDGEPISIDLSLIGDKDSGLSGLKKFDCDRNDSTDPFFDKVIPYLCSFGANNIVNKDSNQLEMVGVCDGQLDYFCAQFTREELSADTTLLNLCGCHLTKTNQKTPAPNQDVGGKTMNLIGEPQTVSPYYDDLPDGDNCDVLCTSSEIQNKKGKCGTPICLIDSVALNIFQSGVGGNVELVQDCDGGRCYIGDVDDNIINSEIKGKEYINQKCGSCWKYEGNDPISSSKKVNCNTLTSSSSNLKLEESKIEDDSEDKNDWIKYTVIFLVVICILGGIAAFFFFR